MDVSTGRQIGGGRFEVLARIGEGGAGVVYAVKDRQSDSRLALKTVRGRGPDALASLKREFRAVQDMTHPNLVRLDELFEEDGTWFFTMELVDGKDWLSYVRPSDEIDLARLRATLGQVVDALAALHAKEMIHRDVKPTNVLVSRDGQVKLLDFGIVSARSYVADPSNEGIVGTLAYMPPEQLLSEEPTPAGDFYALGVMLHQALTGKLPYCDRTRSLSEEKLHGPPTPVRELGACASFLPDDLATLCDALLRSEAPDRPTADGILRVLGGGIPSTSGEFAAAKETFVGREDELRALRDAYAATSHGRTVAVLVEGASGVGKSALVRHFLADDCKGALVLQGRCHEREYVPYKGVDAIVDELAAYLHDSDEVLSEIRNPAMRLLPRLFPVLRRVPFFARLEAGSFSVAEGDASELRTRIFGAFRELVARVAARRSLVLSIDDVQWADGDSLALLSDLIAPPSPPPLLLLCTRRLGEAEAHGNGDRGSTPAPVTLPGDLRIVRLSSLSEDEIAALASRLSEDAPLADAQYREIAKESGGHPLFLQELMRRRAPGGEGASPLRLDDALWDRVLLLEPTERSLVEAAAVAGVPTALDQIAAAAGVEKRALAQHAAQLRGANLVKFSGPASKRRIEPYHDRVREAVLHHLGDEALRGWHERLARVLDSSGERDVERLALHWEGAGDAPRAAALMREAGDRAVQALAFDRAVELYQRSLALRRSDANASANADADTRQLQLALADALFNAGRGREAGETFLVLAGPGGSEGAGGAARADRRALELRIRAANAYFGSGYFNEGTEAIRGVLHAVGLSLPIGRLAVIFRILWNRFRARLRGFGFVRRELATVPAEEVLRFDACTAAGFGLGMADTVRGQVLQFLAVRLALDLGDPPRAARSLCGFALGMASGGVGVAKVTAAAIAKARELAADLADPALDGLVAAASGFATFMLDDWPAAEGFLRAAETTFRDVRGVTYELATVRMMRGRALLQLGRLDALAAYQGPALRDAIRRNDVFAITNTQSTVSALLAIAHDDLARAEAEISAAEGLLAPYGFKLQSVYCLQAGCSIDLYRGAPEGVLARLAAQRLALRTSLFERVQSIRVSLESLRARAHIALASKNLDRRREHLDAAERSARTLSRQGLAGAAAHAELTRAAAAAITGDTQAATVRLRAAAAGFEARGMALHAAASRLALGRLLGGDPASDEARELERAAIGAFEAQGVVAPERYAAHYAPGFGLRSG